MKDNEINGVLKTYFSGQKDVPGRGKNCPPMEILSKYASGDLVPDELYRVGNHIRSCAFCTELVEGALLYSAYGERMNLDSVSDKIKNRAKSLHPGYKIKEHKIMDYLKRNIWFILSLASLTASFFVARYFQQFLILAVIFGLKWVFNRESTRALIMIYNTWKKHDKEGTRELDKIFKNRL